MNGLRRWQRDTALLGPAGDAELAPPAPDAVGELVAEHLSDGVRPDVVDWIYARWKPGVALACAYELVFAGHGRALVVLKRRRDAKAAGLVERLDERPVTALGELQLRAAAWVPGLGALWVPLGDPRLPGLALCEERRSLRRVLDDAGFLGDDVMRRRASGSTLLRYRPERRAVLQLDLALRRPDGSHQHRGLGLRCLEPGQAAAVARRRRAFGSAGPLPELLGHDERRGLLIESWLDVDVPAPDAFEHSQRAGELLAWLHGHAVSTSAASELGERPASAADRSRDLLSWHPELRALLGDLPPLDVAPLAPTWTHGDLHPDQVARSRSDGRGVLLDLDELGPGDPDVDLASWIADRLAEQPECSYDRASAPLLAAYSRAGGRLPEPARLLRCVRAALVSRAAAACRRLELDAARRASLLLRRARALGDRHGTEASRS